MKKQLPKVIFAAVCAVLLQVIALPTNAQYLFCERMGDNAIYAWLGTETGTSSKNPDLKENEFRFRNLFKGTINFYYNNVNITLAPDQVSQKFSYSGKVPTSLTDCRVKINNLPLKSYYDAVAFHAQQQAVSDEVGKKFTDTKTTAELNADIRKISGVIGKYENLVRTLPNWFTGSYRYDVSIKNWNERLEAHKKALVAANTKKTEIATSGSSNGLASTGNSSAASNSSGIQRNTVAKKNKAAELEKANAAKEEEFRRQLAAIQNEQAERKQQQEQLSAGLESVGNMFLKGIQQDQEAKRRRLERDAAYRQRNYEKGELMVKFYRKDAQMGNEHAFNQVIEGYTLMDQNDNKLEFMESMMTRNNSKVAADALTLHYTNQLNSAKRGARKHLVKSITHVAISTTASVLLTKAAYAAEDPTESDVLIGASVLLQVGGGISGFWHLLQSFPSWDPDYNTAKQKLREIEQKRVNFAISPATNLKNVHGLAFRMTF